MKLLVVDDDPHVVELIGVGFSLFQREIEVLATPDGQSALEMVEQAQPDLVLLDIVMPEMDGYDVLHRLREFSDVPVIMLTGKDSVDDKVKGLESGADDYVTKPFDPLELLARTKALLRRVDTPRSLNRLPSFTSEDLAIDFSTREVRLRGKLLALTATEYKLLHYLVCNPGLVLPYGMLLAKVWGPEYVDEMKNLRVYVWRLRRKLEDDSAQPRYILTERGVGYRFARS